MADAGVDETNQSFGNARFCHNVSGQYKERNGKEQKFTDTGIHIGCYDGQGCTGVQDRADRRQTKADANRDTKDQKTKNERKRIALIIFSVPPLLLLRMYQSDIRSCAASCRLRRSVRKTRKSIPASLKRTFSFRWQAGSVPCPCRI